MNVANSNVLITGGAGLVGSCIAKSLIEQESEVTVVDDLSKGTRDRVPESATFIHADVTDPDSVTEAITDDLDIVFHFAAYTDTNFDDDRRLFEENTEMTYNARTHA